jgi:regulator of sigma E protease
MEFLSAMTGFGGSALGVILPFLFVLTVVIFFHELGHFSVARWCGVAIETFSIGFGPEIFGWYDRHGTRWRIAIVPLGGYVKFAGDHGAASTPDEEVLAHLSPEQKAANFHFKPVWQRMAVVFAGPLANFILALAIFAGIFMIVGKQSTPARISLVQPGSPAEMAGFKPRDLVLSIDGRKITSIFEMQRLVMASPEQELHIAIQRPGDDGAAEALELVAVPGKRELTDRFGNTQRVGLLGVSFEPATGADHYVRMDPISAVRAGADEIYFLVERTFNYLGRVVRGVESGDQLSGPIRIAQVSGQMAEVGFLALINLTAALSVSIGLVNLFPVPLLDGGHLVFYGIEALRGRALSARTQEFGFRIGFAVVISLMLFSTWNDLVQLRVVHFLAGLFS